MTGHTKNEGRPSCLAKYKYPSPCEKCTKENCHKNGTSYHHCGDYRSWINFWWKVFPKIFEEAEKKPEGPQKFRYEHPDIVRKYLAVSPCDGCQREKRCTIPCDVYLRWYTAKMRMAKWRMG